MNALHRRGLCRGAAVVLASAAAISLTALSAGMVPALADDPPVDPTDSPSETAYPTATENQPFTPADEPLVSNSALPSETPPATAEMTPSDSASSTTTPSSSSSSATPTTAATQTSTGSSTTSSESTPSVSAAASAAVTTSNAPPPEQVPIVKPEVLQAPSNADLAVAEASAPVKSVPNVLQQNEIDDVTSFAADRDVLQWQPDWVTQDNDFRPVITNPLPDPIQIVYSERGDPRTVTIQPSTRTVLDFVDTATTLTVMVFDAVGELTNVAVAAAFSGPPPASIPDVVVVLDNSSMRSKPFRVGKITDLGEDPDVGERKVLLDGGTPAWGHWTQTTTGGRQFEIEKTQQFPGIDAPAEGPLPGYRLVADSESLPPTDILLLVLAALIAAVAIGVVVHRGIRHKRRVQREQRDRDERTDTRVEARSRPGSMLAVAVRDTPARGEATHALRLATRSHPLTLTVREVNDDHSHTA
jgi:hypothetical protein